MTLSQLQTDLIFYICLLLHDNINIDSVLLNDIVECRNIGEEY